MSSSRSGVSGLGDDDQGCCLINRGGQGLFLTIPCTSSIPGGQARLLQDDLSPRGRGSYISGEVWLLKVLYVGATFRSRFYFPGREELYAARPATKSDMSRFSTSPDLNPFIFCSSSPSFRRRPEPIFVWMKMGPGSSPG